MTDTDPIINPLNDAAGSLERWPGYDEQSWQERFEFLDGMYRHVCHKAVNARALTPVEPADGGECIMACVNLLPHSCAKGGGASEPRPADGGGAQFIANISGKARRIESVAELLRLINGAAEITNITRNVLTTPEPLPAGLEERARELLAAEYKLLSMTVMANEVPNGFINKRDQAALRAIRKALSSPVAEMGPDDGLIRAIASYGGRCRDCADMTDGICENRGLPCDTEQRRAGIKHVLGALAYYRQHPEFVDAATIPETLPSPKMGEHDEWLLRQLEAWPKRVDPEKTTNIVYLMQEAAKFIRSLNRPMTADVAGLIEALEPFAAFARWVADVRPDWARAGYEFQIGDAAYAISYDQFLAAADHLSFGESQ